MPPWQRLALINYCRIAFSGSLTGMIATMTVEAVTGTDIFLAYLDHFLCPHFQPGQVVRFRGARNLSRLVGDLCCRRAGGKSRGTSRESTCRVITFR